MADAIFCGDRLGRLEPSPDQADDLDAADLLQAVEVFLSECAGAGECDLHLSSSEEKGRGR